MSVDLQNNPELAAAEQKASETWNRYVLCASPAEREKRAAAYLVAAEERDALVAKLAPASVLHEHDARECELGECPECAAAMKRQAESLYRVELIEERRYYDEQNAKWDAEHGRNLQHAEALEMDAQYDAKLARAIDEETFGPRCVDCGRRCKRNTQGDTVCMNERCFLYQS